MAFEDQFSTLREKIVEQGLLLDRMCESLNNLKMALRGPDSLKPEVETMAFELQTTALSHGGTLIIMRVANEDSKVSGGSYFATNPIVSVTTSSASSMTSSASAPTQDADLDTLVATPEHPTVTHAMCSTPSVNQGARILKSSPTPTAPPKASSASTTPQDSIPVTLIAAAKLRLLTLARCSAKCEDHDVDVDGDVTTGYSSKLNVVVTGIFRQHLAATACAADVHTTACSKCSSHGTGATNLDITLHVSGEFCYITTGTMVYTSKPPPWPPWLGAIMFQQASMLLGAPVVSLRPLEPLQSIWKMPMASSCTLIFDPGIMLLLEDTINSICLQK